MIDENNARPGNTTFNVTFRYWAVCSWDSEYASFSYKINHGTYIQAWIKQNPQGTGWVDVGKQTGQNCYYSNAQYIVTSVIFYVNLTKNSTLVTS